MCGVQVSSGDPGGNPCQATSGRGVKVVSRAVPSPRATGGGCVGGAGGGGGGGRAAAVHR